MKNPSYRTLSPSDLLRLAEPNDKPVRLRGFRDLLPSGHLFARMPVVVDWPHTNLQADDPVALLRAVNAGGNPLDRSIVLNSATIPLDRVAYAEAIFIPLDPTGVYQHGQLRFVFDEDYPATLTTCSDPVSGAESRFEDLVLSWEVWRYRDDDFTPLRALDEANPLTMRAYTGPQRFLEDSLQGHEWQAYRLEMPGGRDGASELLKVALSVGDGVARHAIAAMMEDLDAGWGKNAPDGAEPDAETLAAWSQLREIATAETPIAQTQDEEAPGAVTYNPLVRSCVAMMRYCILLAAQRMVARDTVEGSNANRIPEPSLGASEPWMREAAHSDLLGVFARAPLALDYLLRNMKAVPTAILDELDKAGLVAHKDGRVDEITYAQDKTLPYGADGLKRRDI